MPGVALDGISDPSQPIPLLEYEQFSFSLWIWEVLAFPSWTPQSCPWPNLVPPGEFGAETPRAEMQTGFSSGISSSCGCSISLEFCSFKHCMVVPASVQVHFGADGKNSSIYDFLKNKSFIIEQIYIYKVKGQRHRLPTGTKSTAGVPVTVRA